MTQQPLTTAQAAERLGVTARMVQVYCRAGRIKAERFGKQDWIIEEAELARFAAIPRRVGQPRKK